MKVLDTARCKIHVHVCLWGLKFNFIKRPIHTCTLYMYNVHVHVCVQLSMYIKLQFFTDFVYCQITEALSEQLLIEDIDSQDADNPQLCAEYAKDIYKYMKKLEVHVQ